MTALDRWQLTCVAVLCLTALCVVGGASSVGGAQSTETPNETVQHERPESVGESGDLQRLQRWLGGQLGQRLESSTVALERGEYDRARALLGDEYDGRLAQYVDVAGETGEGGDAAETYRAVSDDQQSLTRQVRRFSRADERYRNARENDDAAAARAAAREMNRLADRVEDTSGDVTNGYETLANRTGTDTSRERAVVANVTRNVSERRVTVREETFVETRMTVVDATRTISYTEPLTVTGRVTTANGTALADRTLTVAVGGRAQSVTTDANGQFTRSYRPRTLRLNASAVRLAYVPRNDSVYLGSNASVSVDVAQVTPTLTVRESTDETSYGRSVGASVAVTVEGERVNGVPVVANVDGYRIARATTNGTGEARLESPLPASVPAGDHRLEAAVPLRDRAIGPATARTAVTVAPTATNLTIAATRRDGTVSGRLTTDDGRPVADQAVAITRNGSAVTTVSTGPNGTYAASVPLDSAGSEAGSVVAFGGRFDGSGTNLESSRAETTLALPSDSTQNGSDSSVLEDAVPGPAWLVAAVVVLVLALGTAVAWRTRSTPDDEPAEPAATAATPDPSAATVAADPTPAVERAEAFLESGAAGAAVRAAYAAIRERYLTDGSVGTHWELLERAQSLADDERTAMTQVVSAYELVAFSPDEVDAAAATAAVDAARTLLVPDDVAPRDD